MSRPLKLRVSFISLAALMLACGLLLAGLGPAGAAQKAPSAKVQRFLDQARRARTVQELSRAYKQAGLSQAELQEVARLLKRHKLDAKLKSLERKAVGRAKLRPTRSVKPKALLAAKRRAVDKARLQKVRKQNLRLLGLKKAVKSKTGGKKAARAHAAGTQRLARVAPSQLVLANRPPAGAAGAARTGTMRARTPDLSGLPRITREVEVPLDRASAIHGENFGRRRGTVVLRLDRPRYGLAEGLELEVTSWDDNLIRFSAPRDRALEQDVGWEPRPARIWLKPAGSERFQATAGAMVYPDPEQYRMRVESITPRSVSPGTHIFVRGQNLMVGGGRRNAARLRLSRDDQTIETELISYSPEHVEYKVHEGVHGVTSGQATVSIITPYEDSRRAMPYRAQLDFQAAQEVLHFENDSGTHCTVRHPYFLCLAGHRKARVFHEWELINGWVVDEAILAVNPHGINAGAHYEVEPRPGGTRAASRIIVWCDAYSRVSIKEHLYIKGPRGVPYKR
jgi:hypothetical protein